MRNTKHTPTPWETGTKVPTAIYAINGDPISICDGMGEHQSDRANAAFIVRSVNSHELLVAALDDARELLALNGVNSTDTADYGNGRADEIIARIDEALMLARA
jgi:hypothetical protein